MDMERLLRKIYRQKSLIYKVLLLLASSILILYFFPRSGAFKYDFQKGKPWMYENLYAPFDFPIYKTEEDLKEEKDNIVNTAITYYDYDESILEQVQTKFRNDFSKYFDEVSQTQQNELLQKGLKFIDSIYATGVILSDKSLNHQNKINLIKSRNTVTAITHKDLFDINSLEPSLQSYFAERYVPIFSNFFFDILVPNIVENKEFSHRAIDKNIKNIALTRGSIDKGKRIIVKGKIVEGETHKILNSLRKEYRSQTWSDGHYTLLIIGYEIFILLSLSLMILFLQRYYPEVYQDNNKVTFIYLNVVLMIAVTHFVVSYSPTYVYAVPICILPLVLSVFLATRIAFTIHTITLLLLGFVVSNSFEFIFTQIIVGLVVLVSPAEIYKRINLFITVGKILFAYIITYLVFGIIHEGADFQQKLSFEPFSLFLINGLAILFIQPLTYIYEKVFVMVSNLSLLELSDTNSSLLKQLSEKAPGTFYHSLQVANLSEAAADHLGANTLLVRVAALYHDIGKINHPAYFTENQLHMANPHDEISPKESADIIIKHVIDGIDIAKRNNLPDRLIDFIRTHHGTSTVRFFYHQEKNENPDADISDFQYPGPTPFSKETAIVMMADSVEAASRSLTHPTQTAIDQLVDKVITIQIDEGQFLNANITFKEIEQVKKLFKKKLANIYKLRIAYPE